MGNFKKWCADRNLQAHGFGGFASEVDEEVNISNVDRIGKDEVELVNEMIKGVTDLIKWEKELEASGGGSHQLTFPKGQGAAHGPWKDDTFAANDSEIHAPRYFKDYSEFGDALKNAPG